MQTTKTLCKIIQAYAQWENDRKVPGRKTNRCEALTVYFVHTSSLRKGGERGEKPQTAKILKFLWKPLNYLKASPENLNVA